MELKKLIEDKTPEILIKGSYRDAETAMSIYDKNHEYELDPMKYSEVGQGWVYVRRADAD